MNKEKATLIYRNYSGSKVQRFKGSKVQRFKGSKVQRFKVQG